jgi:hypothetical protein
MDMLAMLIGLEERLRQEKATGYDRESIPNQLDDEIRVLTTSFLNGTDLERALIISTFNENHSMTLLLFSERMASLAVRRNSEEILLAGLIAHLIENWRLDPRENLVRLSLLYHAAVKIGCPPEELFSRASAYAPKDIADQLHAFVHRRPRNKAIEAMGYCESRDADGFRYERML